jgi:Zn-dependent oligopeptidase
MLVVFYLLWQMFGESRWKLCQSPDAWLDCSCVVHADMDDLKAFAKDQGAAEGDSMKHWDILFWSERLREAKFSISEV